MAFIGVTTAHLTAAAFDPPVIPLDRTPHDAGITDYRDVTFISEDGITLGGWYIPSRNGAAVILAHGFGGNRLDLLPKRHCWQTTDMACCSSTSAGMAQVTMLKSPSATTSSAV